MPKVVITTTILDEPLNNSSISYKINNGSSTARFYQSDGEIKEEIRKRFIKRERQSLLRWGTTRNGSIPLQLFNTGFNGEVKDFVVIPKRGTRERMVAFVGEFTSFTHATGSTPVNKFCIMEYPEDGTIQNYEATFYYSQSIMFSGPDKVNTVDYDSSRDELAIGGEFSEIYVGVGILNAVPNIFFFDVEEAFPNFSKNENLGAVTPAFDGEITCVKYRNGNECIVAGEFNNCFGIVRGGVAGISPIGTSLVPFNNKSEGSKQAVRRIDIASDGSVYCVGDFGSMATQQRDKMCLLDAEGVLTSFNEGKIFTGGVPKDIVSRRYVEGGVSKTKVVVGGDFTAYGGTSREGLIVLDENANYLPNFNAPLNGVANLDVTRIFIEGKNVFTDYAGTQQESEVESFTDIGRIFISATSAHEPDSNGFILLGSTGRLLKRLYLDGKVNNYITDRGNEMFAGDFTHFDNTSAVLDTHDVEVNGTEDTAINLHQNLVDESINSDSLYLRNLSEVVHEYYYFSGLPIVSSIRDIEDYVDITVEYFDDKGEQISLDTALPVCLLRSEFIVRSAVGDFDTSRFTVENFGDDMGNEVQGRTVIIEKPKLSLQNNTWINVSPLIVKKDLAIDMPILRKFNTNNDTLSTTEQGKYTQVTVDNMVDGVSIGQTVTNLVVLDGFKDDNIDRKTIPVVLMNGRYREVTEGSKFKVGINVQAVKQIMVRGLNGAIINIIDIPTQLGYDGMPLRMSGLINYLKIDADHYTSKYITLQFLGSTGQLLDEIFLLRRDVNCLTGKTEVIFKNRWGLLESTQMVGIKKSSYKVKAEEYDTSIRDVNGFLNTIGHKVKTFSKGGEQTYILSTGIVKDTMNKAYEDLILSEEVWLYFDDKYIPVNISDTNFREKYNLSGAPVEYNFNFVEANNKVRNDI